MYRVFLVSFLLSIGLVSYSGTQAGDVVSPTAPNLGNIYEKLMPLLNEVIQEEESKSNDKMLSADPKNESAKALNYMEISSVEFTKKLEQYLEQCEKVKAFQTHLGETSSEISHNSHWPMFGNLSKADKILLLFMSLLILLLFYDKISNARRSQKPEGTQRHK